jgi:osmotically-inducible protein OsmY
MKRVDGGSRSLARELLHSNRYEYIDGELAMNKTLALTALATSLSLGSLSAFADYEGATKDAWITGKVETVFTVNSHLNPFSIDTDVENGIVHLTGTVESDIDRDLAGELAKGIDGVVDVKNDLRVDVAEGRRAREETHSQAGERPFGAWIDDATTTAAVKSKLLGSANIKGLKIDVDTNNDVVTLTGQVRSSEQSQLAEELAKNTGDVKEVHNNLVVSAN